jgi:hypothetical protein
MDEKIRKMIAEEARAEHGWKVEEMRVDEVERLRRQSCSFYTVGQTVRPVPYEANYALIGGRQVVGAGDGDTAARILDACGAGAPADWWAEIVARFHRDVGNGIVLTDEQRRPDITRQLAAAGRTFERPALADGRLPLTFLLLNPETYIVYRIQAVRNANGAVEVSKTKVPAGGSGESPARAAG